jgi:hypothetical protein
MTAEERTRDLLANIGRSFSPVEREAVASAIRAAEDEALTRAQRATWGIGAGTTGEYAVALWEALGAIEKLKSGGAK